jgi:cytochrome c553
MMQRIHALVLGGGILAGAFSGSMALAEGPGDLVGDRAVGKQLSGQCRTCHGAQGFAQIPIAPHIGGEPASYIAAQLAAFRDGAREHEMMSIVARNLTDQQIADLAAWYAGHQVEVTMAADAAAAPEACVACHGANGLHQLPEAPNLAGETNIYIDTQLKAFRSGKRQHDIMSGIAAEMTDAEIRAVADWYAAIKVTITQVD